MAFLLGYGTAVEWLRTTGDIATLAKPYSLPCLSIEASRTRLERHQALLANLSKPLQLVVWQPEGRRPSAITSCHVLQAQEGLFEGLRVERGVFCSTPAFTFLQMATVLDDDRLRFLGMELCGRYRVADGHVLTRAQVCTPEMLALETSCHPRMRGVVRAKEMASRIHGGSGSPMETALACILCDPVERGGFGLPWPELNHTLPVEGAARRLWNDDHITPDMLWERGKVVIEYDSDLHHSGESRIARDASRRNVLVELGYRVVTVTGEHLSRPRELERVASIVASCLGTPLAEVDNEVHQARLEHQRRMRQVATDTEGLLALRGPGRAAKRAWHSRHARTR